MVRRASSTIKFDRVEIAFIVALFYWLKPLTNEGGEETGVPGENPWRRASSSLVRLSYRAVIILVIVNRLLGLVVRRPPRERKVPGSNPACARIFSGSSHTSDLNIGTPVATLPGAWCYRVSTGTGRPGVSILWLGEMEIWICNFYLSVAARKTVCADPSLRYTSMLLGH